MGAAGGAVDRESGGARTAAGASREPRATPGWLRPIGSATLLS